MLWVIGEEEADLILKCDASLAAPPPKGWDDLPGFMRRSNIEILNHVSNGKKVKEIAPLVFLGERTVDGRIYRMQKIFNCRSLAHLIAIAFRLKLIE